MNRQRQPTPEELALWHDTMAGAAPAREPAAPPAAPRPATAATTGPKPPRASAALDPHRPVDLDRRTWLRLKRGQVAIERTLDLHGQTQEVAHRALDRFLAAAQAAGCRSVLIVTGKGQEGGGTLRQMVPRWLNDGANRERIVAFCPAQPRDGGSGALYVLLRRRRER
jgi:DNA-nicking Smr family endonuclease